MLDAMTEAAREFEFGDELMQHEPSASDGRQLEEEEEEEETADVGQQQQARLRFRREAYDNVMLREMGRAADEFDFADQLPRVEETKGKKVRVSILWYLPVARYFMAVYGTYTCESLAILAD
jgi:hypothetical protein